MNQRGLLNNVRTQPGVSSYPTKSWPQATKVEEEEEEEETWF